MRVTYIIRRPFLCLIKIVIKSIYWNSHLKNANVQNSSAEKCLWKKSSPFVTVNLYLRTIFWNETISYQQMLISRLCNKARVYYSQCNSSRPYIRRCNYITKTIKSASLCHALSHFDSLWKLIQVDTKLNKKAAQKLTKIESDTNNRDASA